MYNGNTVKTWHLIFTLWHILHVVSIVFDKSGKIMLMYGTVLSTMEVFSIVGKVNCYEIFQESQTIKTEFNRGT